ncbi:CPBP family intramembrane metalloprotease [Salmonella enterica]|uniref:CPBP family intramembrane glutamic endopeptidase n=1 Tax=Salmonella enterica TaxID=28901 RepID=UPI000B4957BD|nr:type II CAAX endopeptidase family protein [Salmonella enterica]EBR3873540.1 CPBP family intramembrane metalloprotease [Salmonella enterica subsp. enterica]ECZ5371492.1 CPBP family intramembrane metalloprotease [Salmonella enterica subsp. enterica serovar Give]ASA54076.1 CAAX protease family protein [Salmonella enterica subsp. enterica serovar Minnesota]EAP2901059.1 CPBP family intramembrane metalloprotease [Salmonella enterica]EAW8864055.1 CPBP family intramembrane metalloprotease [Salmonel
MEDKKYSCEYIERNKAVSGCFAMFMLFVGITFIPFFLKDGAELMAKGLLFPIIVTLEFIFIVPLYYIFFRKREGLGLGSFRFKTFFILFLLILLIQYLLPYISGVNETESWSESQMALGDYIFWINAILLIFIAPVYEEIIFRGCLFNITYFWFGNNVFGTAVIVSMMFSVVHLQYTEIRTFIVLFLVSLTLSAARVKSRGLLMPVLLHILMNAVVTGIQYAAYMLPASSG